MISSSHTKVFCKEIFSPPIVPHLRSPSTQAFKFAFFPCLASRITAFLHFAHLSVWVGWLSVVFPSVCYCPLEEISFGCLWVQKSNRYLMVSTFVSRFLSLLRTHQTQQSTKSPMSPKPDTVTSPMMQKRVTRKSADFSDQARYSGVARSNPP